MRVGLCSGFARWLILALPALVLLSLEVDLNQTRGLPAGESQTAVWNRGSYPSPQTHARSRIWKGIAAAAAEVPILPPGPSREYI